jgi:hypothetical protein
MERRKPKVEASGETHAEDHASLAFVKIQTARRLQWAYVDQPAHEGSVVHHGSLEGFATDDMGVWVNNDVKKCNK